MKSGMFARMALPLALVLASAPLLCSDAHAQEEEGDREAKEERRVLKASEFSREQLSEEYRKLARQKRHEEIDFAKELLSRGTMKGETKAEMMLRLADLYFEEGRDIYLSEMLAFEKEYDACFNTEGCNPEGMKPDNAESYKWQSRSIKLYQQILQNYPTFQRADEATFYLASALQDTGERAAAVKEFTRLVKTYPQSGYVPDSYVQIGEYYFDNNNAYKALLAYQKAAAYRDSDKYPFAMYKLAWCYYNVGEYGKSIDTMKTVVAYSMSSTDGQTKSNITLQDEALRDLVRFFADAGEMDEAYAYFNKLGKKELIRSMLKRLATTYFEQGKFEQCIQTYRRLIAEDPQSSDAPEYQHEIIQAYQKIGKKQETVQEVERLRKTYGKNTAWARANASNPDAITAASEYLEKNLRKVAINYHEEARKLGTGSAAKEAYALAHHGYSVYLEEFPDSKHTYEMRYAFGELLYKLKKYKESYVQYMAVVKMDPNGKRSKFCAESAIHASTEVIKAEGSSRNATKGETNPIDLTEWETNKLTALDQFAELFPNEKNTRNVIYESAYLLYNKNHFKKASDRFRVVIGMNPGSKEAMLAANLILDSFTLVEDWSNLKEVSRAFYDQEGLGNTSFKKEVYSIYERASFKLIEIDYESKEDWLGAADHYVAFFEEFPESEVADQALNNAAVYYYKVKNTRAAMSTRHILIEKYPKSKYYIDQVAALGYDYESIANFAEAARWYEKLFSLDKAHTGAKAAIYSAAEFRRAMGEWQQAIKNYQQYMTEFPTEDNVDSVQLAIGQIYVDNEKWENAAKVWQTFFTRKDTEGLSGDELMYARMEYGRALEAQGQPSKALGHYEDTVEWFKGAQEGGVEFIAGIEFVAEMMFKLAQEQYDAYAADTIDGPTRKLSNKKEDEHITKELTDKAKSLQEVEKTYAAIIATGAGEWGLACLVQLGQAYENMGEALKNSARPSYLTDDQVEFYSMAIEDKIYPQVEKAVAAYDAALGKSYELNLYNDNTAFASRRLGELRPDDFPPFYEIVGEPGYTSTTTIETTFETEL